MSKSHYTPADLRLWQGRVDLPTSEATRRWHQVMQAWDLQKNFPGKNTPNTTRFVFLGFASDAGIKRNGGRLGAKDGPNALRQVMGNLAWHAQNAPCFDAGNVVCDDRDLESAQIHLGEKVATILKHHAHPIVLGGGHEVAFGHHLGLQSHARAKNLGIINIDAHFDLRPFDNGGHSGSAFLQIAKDREKQNLNFAYFCLGIQKSANTPALFATAQSLNVQWLTAEQMHNDAQKKNLTILKTFLKQHDAIYLSICLDAFAEAFAPGVSAPSPLGLLPQTTLAYLNTIFASRKVLSLDVAELSPAHDCNHQTAKLAAQLIFHCVELWQKK